MSVPVTAIDPDAQHREWVRAFEYHLDLLPPLMEVLVWMTIPGVSASRFDQVKVSTSGGVFDISSLLAQGVNTAPLHDAIDVWGTVVEYVHAVAASITPTRPAPVLETRPNADPLTARSIALVTIGWLIDHADQIQHLQDDEYRDHMFALIRRLRSRYGVFSTARRPRTRCTVCGETKVHVVYVNSSSRAPGQVQVAHCTNCGHDEGLPDPVMPASRLLLSEACADGVHDQCESVNCEDHCHDKSIEGAS